MRSFTRRRTRCVLGMVVLTAATVVGGGTPASAQTSPSMTIEPSALPNWVSYVSISYENIPLEPQRLIGQCSAAVLQGASTNDSCVGIDYVNGDAGTIQAILYGGFRTPNGQLIDCTQADGACILAIGVPDTVLYTYLPLSFPAPVEITMTGAGRVVTPWEPVQVELTGLMPGGEYTVRQCDPSEVSYGSYFPTGYGCDIEGGVTVTAGPDGTATATIVVKPRFEAASGATLVCLLDACGLGVTYGHGTTVAWADLCMGPLRCTP